MKNILIILKYLAIAILLLIYIPTITILPIVYSLSTSITDRTNIKNIIRESNAYKSFVEDLKPNISDNSIFNKYLNEIIKSEDIEIQVMKISEKLIDDIYNQLEEEKTNISISIDTSEIKQLIILNYLKNYAIGKQTNLDTLTILRCSNELIAKYDKTCPPQIREINNQIDQIFSKIDNTNPNILNLDKNTYVLIDNVRNMPIYTIIIAIISYVLIVIIASKKIRAITILSSAGIVISLINFTVGYLISINNQFLITILSLFNITRGNTNIDQLVFNIINTFIIKIVEQYKQVSIYTAIVLFSLIVLSLVIRLVINLIKKYYINKSKQ